MTTKRYAEDAYAEAHAEALGLLEAIREQIEDMPAPSDQTNWGHVGDMNHVVDLLRAIRATLGEEE
jgi:hypothetical protein